MLCGHCIKVPQRAVIGAVHHVVFAKEQGVSHSGTSRVVLVVEDELIVRSLVAQELRSAGWDVLETSTAEGAIEHLRLRHRVDVVFTDIRLAGPLSGWDVAEQFRTDRVNLPIIYTSGNSFDRSRRVEGSLFFDKPYKTVAIVEACEKLASRSIAQQQQRSRENSET
jgi:CheY-like chemotaxis protein